MEEFLDLIKFLKDLIKMFVSIPVAFLTLFEDRDPLDDDYCYQG
jgi:hypothetical protein